MIEVNENEYYSLETISRINFKSESQDNFLNPTSQANNEKNPVILKYNIELYFKKFLSSGKNLPNRYPIVEKLNFQQNICHKLNLIKKLRLSTDQSFPKIFLNDSNIIENVIEFKMISAKNLPRKYSKRVIL